jgi:SAM-dependent methyltransferase
MQMVTPYATLAPLYDFLFGNRFFPQLRRAFEWLVRRYSIRFNSAADVGCGTGTFVRYLRKCGVPITYGVDRSPDMLRVAIRKNRGNSAQFLLQDAGRLQLPRPVDLITCNFDSLNYLLNAEELLNALHRFYANLNPGGRLIFDMITNQPPWQGPLPRVERVTGPGIVIMRFTNWNPLNGIHNAIVSILQHGRLRREAHIQRAYPIIVIMALLNQAGFALLGVHDFQTLGPANASTSRAVHVAQRPF